MATHRIPDQAEFVGEWFLPSNGAGEQKIAGTLNWSSKRAFLDLHDSFNPLRGAVYGDEVHEYPVVHGTTINSELITLLEASRSGTGLSIGTAGFRQSEKLVSSWIVIGAHVSTQTLYSEMKVRIPGLNIWLCRPGIEQTFLHDAKGGVPAVTYRIEHLPEEENQISRVAATLGWGIERGFSGDLITDISVTTSGWLRISADSPQTLGWFFEQLGKITTLLAFMAGSPMAPDEITATIAGCKSGVSILVALREASYCVHSKLHDFYMLRGNMEADLGVVWSRWFDVYDNIGMPSQLALSVLSSESLWLHVEFLSLMQALEGFHRATMPGIYTSEEEYEEVKNALTNSIPKTVATDHRDALKARIRYGNEVSLRKRLDALVARLQLPLRKHILGGDGSVPRSWVITRNYFTHWDEASRDLALDGIEMHHACVRMRHLLRALYLDLVGIPQTAIVRSLLNPCRESQYLVQLNNAEHRRRNPAAMGTPLMHIGVDDAETPSA